MTPWKKRDRHRQDRGDTVLLLYCCTTTVLLYYYCTTVLSNCTTTESPGPKQLRPRLPQTTKDDPPGSPLKNAHYYCAGSGCFFGGEGGFTNQETTLYIEIRRRGLRGYLTRISTCWNATEGYFQFLRPRRYAAKQGEHQTLLEI